MNFTVERFEIFLFILVRISAFIYSAPIFSSSQIPRRVKVCIAVFITLICFPMITNEVSYVGTIGFAIVLASEALVGLILGYVANICLLILNFAGHMIDIEMGFSMATMFDPMTKVQISVTGNYYSYFVMLMMLVTNMHFFLIQAIVNSFTAIPFGEAKLLSENLSEVMVRFMSEYFIIGFQIILPIFSCILIVNVVLGVLAKIAPQMNMFVVGLQMKVFTGLFILFVIAGMLPGISEFIFTKMQQVVVDITEAMRP